MNEPDNSNVLTDNAMSNLDNSTVVTDNASTDPDDSNVLTDNAMSNSDNSTVVTDNASTDPDNSNVLTDNSMSNSDNSTVVTKEHCREEIPHTPTAVDTDKHVIKEQTDCQKMEIVGAMNSNVENLSITVIQQIREASTLSVDELHKATVHDVTHWTSGTVDTAALHAVLSKLEAGSPWVTVAGSPGEGKSTLGFQVLRHLQDTGRRQIYRVSHPKDFDRVLTKSTLPPVILLDDLFGQTTFNSDLWLEWKYTFEKFLKMVESASPSERGVVIMTGRDFVFKSGLRKTDSHCDLLKEGNYVVNVSTGIQRNYQEKECIWNAIAERHNVSLDPSIVRTICEIKATHGYPHTCKLFATMYKDNPNISTIDFFHKPIQFLTNTLRVLITDPAIEELFMKIIKGSGYISLTELTNCCSSVTRAANDLCAYIKPIDDGYLFTHPSVMDAAALLLFETNFTFVLEHCSLEFLLDRVWLKTADREKRTEITEEGRVLLDLAWVDAMVLVKRFIKEIEKGNLLRVKHHNSWESDDFVKLMVKNMTLKQLETRDKVLGLLLLDTISMKFCIYPK